MNQQAIKAMKDVAYTPANTIRVQIDPEILHDLVYIEGPEGEGRDERTKQLYRQMCALREHQIYRLLRSIVSQFNQRLKGRRERLKIVEEGDGLILEFSSS